MNFLSRFFSKVFSAFGDLFRSEAMAFAARYKSMAVPIILNLASTMLSGPEKRREAFNEVSIQLRKEGVSFATSALNLLIELCVSELKAQKRIN